MKWHRKAMGIMAAGSLLTMLVLLGSTAPVHGKTNPGSGTGTDSGSAPPSLKTVAVPKPQNLSDFVKDEGAAIKLGKALFWDTQVGGDGKVACATCHFHAGEDNRTKNTVHPGPNGKFDIVSGPNQTVTAAMFPVKSDDIVGSNGVAPRLFNHVTLGSAVDDCNGNADGTRQVTGRNSPNMIMAIFNRDNFWDGRAKREFNGVSPAGNGDPTAFIWVLDQTTGQLVQEKISLTPASQASQEVGPPNSDVEMSCLGRTWGDLGRKMYVLKPLAQQVVAGNDSVLGTLPGDYKKMVQDAFLDDLTSDTPLPDNSGYTQIEENFSLFWGLSMMLYGSTLIPNQTPYDKFREGNANALSQEQKNGLALFTGSARCIQCHGGAEFTNASINNGGNGRAFANTGVRPTAEDVGQRPEAKGKFKVPTLRNVELTGPYFHNGGYLTLRQVVEFYNRGGDFNNADKDSQIRPLGLTESQKKSLVSFMLSLTDDRVKCEKAPFDHPSIDLPNGDSIPAVGAGGRTSSCLQPFLSADPFKP